MIRNLFAREYRHFWSLNKQGRAFFLTVLLFDLLSPIYAIFINAFLWRQSQDINFIIIYNLAIFATLPFGFYLNGHLLKKLSVKFLYYMGGLLKAVSLAGLLLLPVVTINYVFLFSICYGLALGLFWSNRNLLHLELTKSSNRIYFSSLDFLSRTASDIFVPAIIGYFLIFGAKSNLYTTDQGYYMIGIGLVILVLSFWAVIRKVHAPANPVSHITLHNKTPKWNYARGNVMLIGLFEGAYYFVPTLMILTVIGKEDVLGVVQSCAAILAGAIIYTVARSINTKHRLRMIQLSVFFSIIGTLAVGIFYSPIGIFAFIGILAIAQTILLTENQSIIFDLIDKETKGIAEDRYAYIFDHELFLNMGRFSGVLLFAAYVSMFSLDFAIRFTPFIFALTLTALIFFSKVILQKEPTPLDDNNLSQTLLPQAAPEPAPEVIEGNQSVTKEK